MLAFLRTRFKRLAGFGSDRKAVVAVEFALIAAPLVFMICACVELCMVFFVSVTLDNATQMAARGIRTGNTTTTNTTKAQFAADICNNMGWLAGSCPTSLALDVEAPTSFPNAAQLVAANPVSSNGQFQAPLNYNVGTGSQIQLIRAYYTWPLFTPLLNPGLVTLGSGDALLTSTVIFRNEPF